MNFRNPLSRKATSRRSSKRFQFDILEDRVTPSVTLVGGALIIAETSTGNDKIDVTAAPGGAVTVSSNLGSGTFAGVTAVDMFLLNGNDNIKVDSLSGVAVYVAAGTGNNNITIGNEASTTIGIMGGGHNTINVGTGFNYIVVFGDGNNNINAAGTGDFIYAIGNGNNNISDTGTGDSVLLDGTGNNHIDNAGPGSVTALTSTSTGHNKINGTYYVF